MAHFNPDCQADQIPEHLQLRLLKLAELEGAARTMACAFLDDPLWLYLMNPALIIGAGMAGLTAAAYLVEVYSLREHP